MALEGYEPFSHVSYIGTVVPDSDAVVSPLVSLTKKIKLTSVKVAFNADVTASDTDYETIAIYAGDTRLLTLFANTPEATGTTFAKGAFTSYTVPAAKREVDADTALSLHYVKGGDGVTLYGLVVQLSGVCY